MFYTKVNRREIYLEKKFLFQFILLTFILFGINSCSSKKDRKRQILEITVMDNILPYDLKNPESVYQLPAYLEEISGISYYKENEIACIQDEQAIIYIFDILNEEVKSIIDFRMYGDFEDLAIVGSDVYILRSDGTLFKGVDFEKYHGKLIKIETALEIENNAEGLFYNKNTNSLFIACKDSPSINNNELYAGYRAIYRFDLGNSKLTEEPEYLVDLSKRYTVTDNIIGENIFTDVALKLGLIEDVIVFHPSAIAIHPVDSGNLYILSSIGKSLIITDKYGSVLNFIKLDKRIFNQPEGICFSKNGELFISNEGENKGGDILRFKYLYPKTPSGLQNRFTIL